MQKFDVNYESRGRGSKKNGKIRQKESWAWTYPNNIYMFL